MKAFSESALDASRESTIGRRRLLAGVAVAAGAAGVAALKSEPAYAATADSANLLDYGADPTGVADSTAAFTSAAAANPNIFIPAGTYKVSTLSFSSAVTLRGASNKKSIVRTTSLTGNVITLGGNGWHVENLGFDATGNRTSGAYIKSVTGFSSIRDCSFTKYYTCIDLDGSFAVDIQNIDVANGTPSSTAAGGAIIRLGTTGYTSQINILGLSTEVTTQSNDPAGQPSYGLVIGWVDVVSIINTLIIHHGTDVLVNPGNGQFAALIEMTNSCIDTATRGMVIAPTGTGRVLRMGIANTWFGAHSSDGVKIDAGSTGSVTGVQFANCQFGFNGGNGIVLGGSTMRDVTFANSVAYANGGDGLKITSNAQNVRWDGGTLGASHEGNGNVGYGFSAVAGTTGSVSDANLEGNSLGRSNNPGRVIVTSGNTPDAWESTTATPTSTSGTLTSASGSVKYKIDGRTVFFSASLVITTNGTGSGGIQFPLPVSAKTATTAYGRQTGLGGQMVQGYVAATGSVMVVYRYDGGYPASSGETIVVSGQYEF